MPQANHSSEPSLRTAALLPYLWFTNIIRIQEKKAYSATTVLLFCMFVAIARVMGEWFIGARSISYVLGEVFGNTVVYWHLFFSFGLILFLLVPQSWRKSINVVLIGIFLGIFPPLIDMFVYDFGSVRYTYFWEFPDGWQLQIYNPERHFHFGETLVLWMTVWLTAAYVGYKTRSWWRTAIAAVLAYGVVLLTAGLIPSLLRDLQESMGWSFGHLVYMMTSAQIVLTIFIYILFQPRLRWGLLKRTHHSLPFVAMALIGAAFAGTVNGQVFWYAFLVWLMFQTALVQNDYYDRVEDDFQGREPHVDGEDVAFFSIVALMLIFATMMVNAAAGMLLLMIFILSVLYSFPLYRGKRYFPSNLKMEGGWGLSAFLVGMLAALEYQVHGTPRWTTPLDSAFATSPVSPGWTGIIACFLVFGGHSLLAMLKDYKDVQADQHGRIHTVYTLAARRGKVPARVHRIVAAMALICLMLPLPLLYLSDRISVLWVPLGLGFVGVIASIVFDLSSKSKFDTFLWLTSGYLLYLFLALTFG